MVGVHRNFDVCLSANFVILHSQLHEKWGWHFITSGTKNKKTISENSPGRKVITYPNSSLASLCRVEDMAQSPQGTYKGHTESTITMTIRLQSEKNK